MESPGQECFLCNHCNTCFRDKHKLTQHQQELHHQCKNQKEKNDDNYSTKGKRGTTEVKKQPELRINIHRIIISPKLLHKQKQARGHGVSQCNICNSKLSSVYGLKVHIAKVHHHVRPYKCSYCNKCFYGKSRRREHERIHTGERPVSCGQCNKSFGTRIAKNAHVRRMHNKEINFNCSVCAKPFFGRKDLQNHERTHTGQKPFGCTYCSKAFATADTRNKHIRSHLDEKPYSCFTCQKSFRRLSTKIIHDKMHSGVLKRHQCKLCLKYYGSKHYLAQHVKVVHIKQREYKCSYCDACFSAPNSKKQHEQNHLGEKRFGCEYCDKKFNQQLHLENHINRSHLHLKPYKCGVCSYSAVTRREIKVHEATNHFGLTPFKCSVCPLAFISQSVLRTHSVKHTNQKPFSCEVCGKAYKWASGKRRHVKSQHSTTRTSNST